MSRSPSSWNPEPRLAGVLLVLVVLLAYLPAIVGGSFHYDDSHHVVGNPAVRPGHVVPQEVKASSPAGTDGGETSFSLARAAKGPGLTGLAARSTRFFTDPGTFSGERGVRMYRPVLMVTYAVDHFVWGYRPAGWILTNTLLHALVALLVWRLALRLGLPPGSALLAGAVMGLHPAFSEVVNYVSSRSESVAAALLLTALLFHLRARADGTRHRPGWLAASWATAILACLAKETAAPFAGVVFLVELLRWRRPWKTRWLHAVGYSALYGAGLAVVLLIRGGMLNHASVRFADRLLTVKAGADPRLGGGRSIVGNLLVQARVVVLYLQLFLKPVRLSIDHDVVVTPAGVGPTVVAVCGHLGAMAVAVVSALRGHRMLPLGIGLFWVLLSVSVVVPLNVVMNEHRLYMPGIAVALLAGAALGRVADLLATRSGRFGRSAILAFAPLLLFVPLVIQRSGEWRSDLAVWEAARERSPESAIAHMHYGAALHEQAKALKGREQLRVVDLAIDSYLDAEALHRDWLNLQLDLGNVWLMRARLTRADGDFEHSVAAFEHLGSVAGEETERWRLNKSAALLEWGRYDEAEAMVRRLDDEDDAVTPLYDDLLARILRKKGDSAGAAEAMARVVELERARDQVDGMLTLGWWHFEDAVAARKAGRPQAEVQAHLSAAEDLVGQADTIADRTRDRRPALYIARFLYLMGQPDHETFREKAEALGWRPEQNPAELAWSKGGRTPSVHTGTVGVARDEPAH